MTATESKLSRNVDRLVAGIARHWLAIFNTGWAIYVLLPVLAPILMHFGFTTPARMIYAVYSFACHQLPDHSYFLFGNNWVPLAPELEANGMEAGLNLFQQRRFIGNESLGYKFSICERDMAIYGSVLLAGLFYGIARKRRRMKALSWKLFLVLLIPMALDGTSQLVGFRESNWWLRSLTGALFGAAAVWFAYPHIDEAMDEVVGDV